MVYSRSLRTRAFIEAAVVCALSLSAFPSIHAEGSTASDPSAAVAACGISDGDKSVGIRAVDDSTCATGGLGCYNDHCRFCKVLDTPQSTAFTNCSSLGADFPSMAPLVVSTFACEVSDGDAAVGISAMIDPACLYGGLGCFDDHCRFCKLQSTPQSSAFVDCSGAGSTSGTPSTTTAAPDATSDTPAVETTCSLVAAAGDVAVGITIGTDPTCSSGGIGCINDVCRFCRLTTSLESAPFVDCTTLVGGIPSSESPSSTSTPAPPATTETPITTADATDLPTDTPPATTETPTVADVSTTANAPTTTDAPASTTDAPVTQTTCTIVAAAGDVAVGINITTDPTCSSGGVGCIDDICRFCKVKSSVQSAAFVDCSLFGGDASSTAVPTEAPSATTEVPSVTTEVPSVTTEAPSATTEAPSATTEAPSSTSETPAAATTTPDDASAWTFDASEDSDAMDTTSDAPDATPEAPTTTTATPVAQPSCTQVASSGDASVGIKIVTDATCSSGGVGCMDDVCRFCKVTTTTQSAAFVDCASIEGSADTTTNAPDATTEAPAVTTETPAATTEAPAVTTETPAATTEAPAVTTETPAATTEAPVAAPTCTQVASSGDASVGIQIVTDATCSTGGVGCIDDVCRFCKLTPTIQSAAFADCASIEGSTLSSNALTDTSVALSDTSKVTLASAEQTSDGATSQIQQLFNGSPAQIGAGIAGCVGVAAVVAMLAIAVKRTVARRTASYAQALGAEEDEQDAESGQSVVTASSVEEPSLTGEA